MSWQQQARQKARSKRSGRYEDMNRCEDCNKPVGNDYFTFPGGEMTGDGVCLCAPCYRKRDLAADSTSRERK